MSMEPYGIWCGHAQRVTAETAEQDSVSPHIYLYFDDGSREGLQAAINVKSASNISELAYYRIDNFQHPVLDIATEKGLGWHELAKEPNSGAMDYIRGNMVNFEDGILLPHDIPGRENDLLDVMMPIFEWACNKNAKVYIWGEQYSSGNGTHATHMNQGSAGSFVKYNGVWQDGGVIIEDADNNRYIAILTAFGSQALHTDETTGNALPNSQLIAELFGYERPANSDDPNFPILPKPDDQDLISDGNRVAIVAALVNPDGPEGQPEHTGRPELVYLMNRTNKGISLANWQLLNRNDEAHKLAVDTWLAPGEVRALTMGTVPLANSGGLISLLDDKGLKVDGVSYTREQARKSGELILFR